MQPKPLEMIGQMSGIATDPAAMIRRCAGAVRAARRPAGRPRGRCHSVVSSRARAAKRLTSARVRVSSGRRSRPVGSIPLIELRKLSRTPRSPFVNPSYDITTTGAADVVAEASEATKDAVRKSATATKRTARKARKVPGVAQAEGQIKDAVRRRR